MIRDEISNGFSFSRKNESNCVCENFGAFGAFFLDVFSKPVTRFLVSFLCVRKENPEVMTGIQQIFHTPQLIAGF